MRLMTYRDDDALRLGVVTRQGVLDVAAASRSLGVDAAVTPAALYASGTAALPALRALLERIEALPAERSGGWYLDPSTLEPGPCVPAPGKILCVGLNYRRHAREAGFGVPETPVLFSKFGNTIAATGDPVTLPAVSDRYDYEAELVVVMGATARSVSEEDALDYVLGYCNGNDLSARDLQTRTGQWLLGKTLDGFLPIGPHLVTADEIPDPQDLRVRCWLNGELRQDSTTADMVFGVAEIVAYASRYMTLQPGDVIATGTPEGVILGMDQPVWLQPGDEVIVEVGSLGRLVTPLVAPVDGSGTAAAGRDATLVTGGGDA
jgi:2-keto-4-pentenoate hydratase/2-oxohepta-3-ene-1,7-dioic acid hydratase in catechol pathway